MQNEELRWRFARLFLILNSKFLIQLMAVPRSGVVWRPIFAILLIATTAHYVWYSRREFAHGGSKIGIGYGIAGTALILLLYSMPWAGI